MHIRANYYEKVNEKYNSIDIFKLIMSIVVIAIHTNSFANVENYFVQMFWGRLSENSDSR